MWTRDSLFRGATALAINLKDCTHTTTSLQILSFFYYRSFVDNASIFHHPGNREMYCDHLNFTFWCHCNNISSSILMNSSKLEKQDNVFWNPGWLGRQHPWNSAARFFVAFHGWIVFIFVTHALCFCVFVTHARCTGGFLWLIASLDTGCLLVWNYMAL